MDIPKLALKLKPTKVQAIRGLYIPFIDTRVKNVDVFTVLLFRLACSNVYHSLASNRKQVCVNPHFYRILHRLPVLSSVADMELSMCLTDPGLQSTFLCVRMISTQPCVFFELVSAPHEWVP